MVLQVLDFDTTAVVYVPQEISTDEEIKNYINENIDLKWSMKFVPEEKIPDWIKEFEQSEI